MDPTSIAKDFIGLQKLSFNNFVDALIIFQDNAEDTSRRWSKQLGIDQTTREFAEKWRAVFKRGRDDSRKFINDSYTSMENYFKELEETGTTRK
jgi:hypothetical protein